MAPSPNMQRRGVIAVWNKETCWRANERSDRWAQTNYGTASNAELHNRTKILLDYYRLSLIDRGVDATPKPNAVLSNGKITSFHKPKTAKRMRGIMQ